MGVKASWIHLQIPILLPLNTSMSILEVNGFFLPKVMQITDYLSLSNAQKYLFLKMIATRNPRFEPTECLNNIYLLDKTSNTLFSYIPSGTFEQGLSTDEQETAESIFAPVPANYDEMRPVKIVHVSEFYPFTKTVLSTIDRNDEHMYPLFCSYEQSQSICHSYGMRLPSESEWEFSARAGGNSLFPFGNELPTYNMLAKYMALDFRNLSPEVANPLGLFGLFTGEWCSDLFASSYDSALTTSSHVIRGGGAQFWPWQDNEWVWCMSAMRMPASDLPDNSCGFRMVFDL